MHGGPILSIGVTPIRESFLPGKELKYQKCRFTFPQNVDETAR